MKAKWSGLFIKTKHSREHIKTGRILVFSGNFLGRVGVASRYCVVLSYLAVFWKNAVPLLFSTFKVDISLSIHVPALSGIAEMFVFIVSAFCNS